MMQLLNDFIDLAEQALEQNVEIDNIANMPLLRRIRRMNEDIGEDQLEEFETLTNDMENAFAKLVKEVVHHAR